MSVWTGTNPSPGPRRRMKMPPRSTLSPKGARGSGVKRAPAKKADFVTEILCGRNKPGQAVAPQPLGGTSQPLKPSFVFYNIPGSFVQFRPSQIPSAASRGSVIISSGMRYQPSALSSQLSAISYQQKLQHLLAC
jgi:hypothetical protein